MNRSVAEDTSNQEYALLEYVGRLSKHREGRRAIHLHLSTLKSFNKADYQIRIAVNTFETTVKTIEGQLFKLSNNDIFFIYRDATPEEIDDAVMKLSYLFDDDPLTHDLDRSKEDGLCSWYDVERQYEQLLLVVKKLYEVVQKRQQRLAMLSGTGPSKVDFPPINPNRLGELIDTIAKADLSNVMRRQIIYAVLTNQPPRALFRELFISIPELRDLIMPGYNITANRALFQYLTETLDKRMLALLIKNDDPDISSAFSLNLNVSSLLSPEFLAFDSALKQGARGSILIELQVSDIYADLSAYLFARDFLHGRGYRICLDGLTTQTLNFVDRRQLGADFIKLVWSPDMIEGKNEEQRLQLKELIDKNGKVSSILCRVDNEDAVNYGKSIGIAMFQGRYLDQLANAARAPTLTRSALR
jgi:hypothetical protein